MLVFGGVNKLYWWQVMTEMPEKLSRRASQVPGEISKRRVDDLQVKVMGKIYESKK